MCGLNCTSFGPNSGLTQTPSRSVPRLEHIILRVFVLVMVSSVVRGLYCTAPRGCENNRVGKRMKPPRSNTLQYNCSARCSSIVWGNWMKPPRSNTLQYNCSARCSTSVATVRVQDPTSHQRHRFVRYESFSFVPSIPIDNSDMLFFTTLLFSQSPNFGLGLDG
jgi:hypothetical protein